MHGNTTDPQDGAGACPDAQGFASACSGPRRTGLP